MPIPQPPEIQSRAMETQRPPQVKRRGAATAPAWKITRAAAVLHFPLWKRAFIRATATLLSYHTDRQHASAFSASQRLLPCGWNSRMARTTEAIAGFFRTREQGEAA